MSNPLQTQLEEVFSVVFPDVPTSEFANAAMGSLAAWDSLATLTLAAVIEESFGVQIAPDDLPSLVSFSAIQNYLARQSRAAA